MIIVPPPALILRHPKAQSVEVTDEEYTRTRYRMATQHPELDADALDNLVAHAICLHPRSVNNAGRAIARKRDRRSRIWLSVQIALWVLLLAICLLLVGRARAQDLVAPVTTASLVSSSLTSATQAIASTNATSVKAGPGNVYTYRLINTTGVLYYLRMYNLATTPSCASATGFVESIPIPFSTSGSGLVITQYPQGFSAGIGFCITGGPGSTDNTSAAAGVFVTILYR